MKTLNLCLHAGGHVVEFNELASIPLPERTESYVPVPHQTLFGMVTDHMKGIGLNILQSIHATNRGGKHYFGMMEVAYKDNETNGFVVAVRNSYDKSLSAAMVAGSQIFCCDNLALSGEYKLSRKHTVNVFADLPALILAAVSRLTAVWEAEKARTARYMERALSDMDAHNLIANLWRNGALLKTEIATAIDEWHKPSHPEFEPRTLWSLQNAATEAWKGGRLDTLTDRSLAMYRTLDAVLV